MPPTFKKKEFVKPSIKDISKSVYSKANSNEDGGINSISSNAAKFASIINKHSNEYSTKVKPTTGINLNQNRFSELFNIEGRYWDSNSNENENSNSNSENYKNTNTNTNKSTSSIVV